MSKVENFPKNEKQIAYIAAFAIMTLLAFSQALTRIMEQNSGHGPVVYWRPIVNELTGVYAVGVLIPVLILFCHRFPFSLQTWPRILPLHVLACALYSSAQIVLMFTSRLLIYPLFGDQLILEPFWRDVLYEFNKQVWAYTVLITAIHGWRYFSISRRRAIENARLEALLAKSQLDHLKMQIHPHFLFNTLNTISSLIHSDAEKADRLLTQLSELLRISITDAGQATISLGEEVRFLDLYNKIMLARFEEDLEITMDIEPATLKAQVPPFVLQPLVENAIRYATVNRGGLVWIRGQQADGQLLLSVADNGPGCDMAWEQMLCAGVGLSNTQARLESLYGDRFYFEGNNLDGGGYQVTLRIPFEIQSNSKKHQALPVMA